MRRDDIILRAIEGILLMSPVLLVLGLCAPGCSHNPATLVMGKRVHIGTPEYGELSYLNGFGFIDCSRENSSWEMEINDQEGLSFDPTTNTLKGVKVIRRRIGKQVSGYLTDLAKVSPDAATEYLKGDVMPVGIPATARQAAVQQSQSTPVQAAKDTVKAAVDTVKATAFCPTGNCSAKGQGSNPLISYQRRLAANLLAFSPSEKIATDTTVSARENLSHFISRMDALKARGKATTRIRIESYTIKARTLTALRFVCPKSDGTSGWEDVDCVECYDLEFDD